MTQRSADPSGQQELWEVVPGEEADDWGIRIVGEIHGKSIAQIMWEHDAKEVVRLHNSAQVQMSAREWWKANRDNFVNGFSGSGLATRSEYDIPAVLEAFTRSRDGGKGNG